MNAVPSPVPPPPPAALWTLYAALHGGGTPHSVVAGALPPAPTHHAPQPVQPRSTEAAGAAQPAAVACGDAEVTSEGGEEVSSSDGGASDTVCLFDKAAGQQPAGEEEESEETSEETDEEAGDGTAAMAVNNAWINMFVASEMKRREKERVEKEKEAVKARRPVERADAKKRQQMIAIYGESSTHEIECLESKLHASYERRVKGKAPIWPCTPLNFMEHQLVSKVLDIDPIVIQKQKLDDADTTWPGAKRLKTS